MILVVWRKHRVRCCRLELSTPGAMNSFVKCNIIYGLVRVGSGLWVWATGAKQKEEVLMLLRTCALTKRRHETVSSNSGYTAPCP